jgi:uncharacterized protein
MIRALLDTNVLVSGIIQEKGIPRHLFDEWLSGRYELVTSFYLIAELKHVLAYPRLVKRLQLRQAEIAVVLNELTSRADIVAADPPFEAVSRDVKDNGVVAAALQGTVDYLVSGDRDLLDLEEYQGIRIVTPAQFRDIIATL